MTSSPHALPELTPALVHEPGPESNPERLPFSQFFEDWLRVQDEDLHELMAIATAHSESTQCSTELTQHIREHVNRVMSHYENYYQVKAESTKKNVLLVLSPNWVSKLEDAFQWIGGWRPTIAFHLLYSKVGLQFEVGLSQFLMTGVISTSDLGVLSPLQFVQVDELHRKTIREERKLTERFASHQETMADTTMVELSKTMTELTRSKQDGSTRNNELDSLRERVKKALAPKERGLQEILVLADELRLNTLKSVVDILSPIQAVHFLIASIQHHLRFREWGLMRDEDAKTMQEESRGLPGPKPSS